MVGIYDENRGELQEKYWELLLDFAMVAAQMDPNYKNSRVLSIEVEPGENLR